jgi:hypothetical protein
LPSSYRYKWTIEFTGTLANTPIPLLKVTDNTGTAMSVSQNTVGSSTTNEKQDVEQLALSSGTFKLIFSEIAYTQPEVAYAIDWVMNTLKSDSTLTTLVPAEDIYLSSASLTAMPANRNYIIVIDQENNNDHGALGGERIGAAVTVKARVIASNLVTNYSDHLRATARRIDEILHGKDAVTGEGVTLSCVRTSELMFMDSFGATLNCRHMGGLYDLFVQTG